MKPLPEKEKYLTQKRCFISVNLIIWSEFLCLQPIKLSKGPLALGFLKIRMSLRRDLVAYCLLRIWDYRFVVQCKHILIHSTATSFSVLLASTSLAEWQIFEMDFSILLYGLVYIAGLSMFMYKVRISLNTSKHTKLHKYHPIKNNLNVEQKLWAL